MLIYLTENTHPDIAYSVHKVARFYHNSKVSLATAIKRIVDSNFGGLFGSEDTENYVSVELRTGYFKKFRSVTIIWVSKLQTQIALLKMEAECLASSKAFNESLKKNPLVSCL